MVPTAPLVPTLFPVVGAWSMRDCVLLGFFHDNLTIIHHALRPETTDTPRFEIPNVYLLLPPIGGLQSAAAVRVKVNTIMMNDGRRGVLAAYHVGLSPI